MTTFQIKISAIVLMIIDHVGLFFFPQLLWPRVLGRIAFPLFAWLIANGAMHTRDMRAYGGRLLILALVSQVPFAFANTHIGFPFFYLNVVFTLTLGLLAIYAWRELNGSFARVSAVIGCALLANILHADYGAMGVLSIVAFYVFFKDFRRLVLSQVMILGVLPVLVAFLEVSLRTPLSQYYNSWILECFGLLALVWIAFYNGKLGIRANMLFYYFYPLQYVLIYLGLLIFR